MNITKIFLSAALLFGSFYTANAQTIVQQWLFNEGNGTTLNAVSNSVGGGASYASAISGVTVQSGNLQIRSSADANSYTGNVSYTSGIYQLDLVISGWNLVTPTTAQGLFIGFLDTTGGAVTADIAMQSTGSGLSVNARSLGTGGGNSTSYSYNTLTQSAQVALRLIANFDANTTQLLRKDDSTSGNFVSIGTGTIDSSRNGNFLRIRTTGNWSETAEFLNVDSITYTLIPEPSTWALLAGSLTVLAVFRRRRKS